MSRNQIWAAEMKLSLIMWFVMLFAASVVLVQYYVSSVWTFSGAPNTGTGNRPLFRKPSVSMTLEEELLEAIVDKIPLDDTVAVNIGHEVFRDSLLKMGRQLLVMGACNRLSELENNTLVTSKSRRLYIITPTYRRPEQIPDLTRMAQTLLHIPHLHWLVIEDAVDKTPLVTELLERTGISYDHLVAPMPAQYTNIKGSKPRGVSNRNRGVEWIRENAKTGVLYFADDDNTYDIRLFEEIRTTKRVSMFPVGLCTETGVSSPVVVNGSFVGFYDGWIGSRKFPVDMASFAVSVEFLLQRPNAKMPYSPGYEEDGFLKSLAPFEPKEIELKANNCTEILVWHTQTKKNFPSRPLNMTKYANTNLVRLKQLIV
ncbi:galactosylgalactosylxylosylprotein 3-beta-glucuronosyltransferase P-like isoform X2 [Periplaneta americana]|uniref:galactosylgalactosylxylosylprotein 3-beta-glucuronosyltransferase P-like isoform X2 n=1 Tax=Periplaneta americana TaxID=6978 RepID=UPI0037E7CC1F